MKSTIAGACKAPQTGFVQTPNRNLPVGPRAASEAEPRLLEDLSDEPHMTGRIYDSALQQSLDRVWSFRIVHLFDDRTMVYRA